MLKKRPFIARMLASALLTVCFFGTLEWALSSEGWSALYEGDPHHDWWLKPSLRIDRVSHVEQQTYFPVNTNAEGFRDGPIPMEKPWVLALGCSTTFGWGVSAERSWPEVLEASLGVPVFNAGVPGHSSEQGRRVAERLLAHQPSLVILGWGLRDAQKTAVPDVYRRPATFPRNTAVYGWLSQKLRSPGTRQGHMPRVSKERFMENLSHVVDLAVAQDTDVLLLDMTGRSETPGHSTVLGQLGRPVVVPDLSSPMVFEHDPIHLNAAGNHALAELLSPTVIALLDLEPVGESTAGSPPRTP